ncbi:MAG: hypothetical protein AB7S38_17400 [Vulcanimicrobiota bacterium]
MKRDFSEALKQALAAAVTTARGGSVHSGHLLAGLLQFPRTKAARILTCLGLTQARLEELEVSEDGAPGDFTRPVRQAMASLPNFYQDRKLAIFFSGRDEAIFPEQLAYSLIREPSCQAPGLLGLELDRYMAQWEWLSTSSLGTIGSRRRRGGEHSVDLKTDDLNLRLALDGIHEGLQSLEGGLALEPEVANQCHELLSRLPEACGPILDYRLTATEVPHLERLDKQVRRLARLADDLSQVAASQAPAEIRQAADQALTDAITLHDLLLTNLKLGYNRLVRELE